MNQHDQIRIEGLECFAYHGLHEEENVTGQRFYIDATLYTDIRPGGQNDDISLTTNYSRVADLINHFMTKTTYKLLETVAERLATEILLHFPLVCAVDLEIKKPHAPLRHSFDSVSVRIRRGWQSVYVGIGSNIGDSHQLIQSALKQMAAHPLIRDLKASALCASTPYGVTDQADFINGAIAFSTLLTPYALLDFLQELEAAAGRKRGGGADSKEKSARWGPRTLDLDILIYGDILMNEERLTIPHPDMVNRDFVLAPLAEIAPQLKHPVLGHSVGQLLAALSEKYIVRP